MMLEVFKNQVKETVDLRQVFERYGIVLERMNGQTSKCCCPVHKEKTASCHVHQDYFYCYGCQASGDVLSFLMDRENVDFMESLTMAAEGVNMTMPERTQRSPEQVAELERQRTRQELMRTVLTTCRDYYRECLETMPVGNEALNYCKRRKWTKDTRERFGIGYAPDDNVIYDAVRNALPQGTDLNDLMLAAGMTGQSDGSNYHYLRFKQRVMFPVHDARGRLCGFSGRWIPLGDDDTSPRAKYLNTPATDLFDKGGLLYGLHLAARSMGKQGKAVVVEGQPDVIACHVAGIEMTVAPMGTALTAAHVKLLKRMTGDGAAYLVLDGDKAGQAAIRKSVFTFLQN